MYLFIHYKPWSKRYFRLVGGKRRIVLPSEIETTIDRWCFVLVLNEMESLKRSC